VAKKTVVRSTVVDSETGEVKTDPIRTSSQTFLKRGHDKVTQVGTLPSCCRCGRAAVRTRRATEISSPHVSREVSSQPPSAAVGRSGGEDERRGAHVTEGLAGARVEMHGTDGIFDCSVQCEALRRVWLRGGGAGVFRRGWRSGWPGGQ
jgi:hypothetical protein